MRRALYAITADLLALDDLIESVGGDLTDPQVDAAVTAWAGELERDLEHKLDGWVAYLRTLEMEHTAAKAEVEQWLRKAQERERRITRMKATVLDVLQRTGRAKVVTAGGRTVSVVANGGKPGLVFTSPVSWEELPGDYVRVTRSIDNDAIRADLEAGKALPFARLADRGHHLRVR